MKKRLKIKVGMRGSHQFDRLDTLRYGSNGYGSMREHVWLDPERVPVDVFMRAMSRKWGQQ